MPQELQARGWLFPTWESCCHCFPTDVSWRSSPEVPQICYCRLSAYAELLHPTFALSLKENRELQLPLHKPSVGFGPACVLKACPTPPAEMQFWLHLLKAHQRRGWRELCPRGSRTLRVSSCLCLGGFNPTSPWQGPTLQPPALLTHLLKPYLCAKQKSKSTGQKREQRKSVSMSFNTEEEGDVSLVAAIGHFINNWYRYNKQTIPGLYQGYFSQQ